ncbi:YicC/YloC family endoribonuclease [Leadbettera azotonutricia]|uniref:YicC family protein n=1 Tax=Leadbettera azotonutricia (strain ATCC BAA-888 / DSM 13862 / ZAS-9) TaxID=545695 RepID=F5YAD0_LEAAZ|nr:YicC/YloC family endoribonuclease [Leadbettera azotonutricia]AEF80320.1 conserved hypothetical protein [Leadbettera azotonutricia ZAS-9]
MKSMTGYAYSEKNQNDITVSVEIKGYNSRFLDLSIYLPNWLSSLESEIRSYISSRFSRGKIEAAIRLKEHDAALSVSVNKAAAQNYFEAIKDLSRILGINEEPGLEHILKLEGVLEVDKNRDDEKYKNAIMPVLIDAADKFGEERIREGKHTEADIFMHIALLEKHAAIIAVRSPELEKSIKENLRTRFAELLGDKIDETRILAETAVLLMKYTISEELSRLSSHLQEFRLETERNPSPGKKLDFLCQEINREVNTIGSKSPVIEVSRAVVEMKNALENIREQLRNVE